MNKGPPRAGASVSADAETREQTSIAGPLGDVPVSAIRTVVPARTDLFRPGELLGGNYEIRTKLGEGGMGQVYEAVDRTLARRVAIKAAHPSATTSLVQEARALAALRHPSIVSVHHVGEHAGVPYVVMERLHGRTLEALLDEHRRRGTSLSIEESVDVLASIADGLGVVHRAGMAHRDVKPANVMLAPGGRVVLTDFGIFQPENVRETQLAGSPPYVAPEILAMRVGLGELYLVDVYALGVVAHEVLTGQLPFDDPDVVKVLTMHATEPAPDGLLQRSGVPPQLSALVLQMLAKDPRARPHSMDEIAWQLRRHRDRRRHGDRRCSVVIAEDNAATGAILTAMVLDVLPEAEVRLARDGSSALEMVTQRPPDLFIVDVDLPALDGIAVCERLRDTAVARSCTVVATSSRATAEQTAQLRAMGFVGFVPKGAEMARKLPLLLRRAQRRLG